MNYSKLTEPLIAIALGCCIGTMLLRWAEAPKEIKHPVVAKELTNV